jgi:hypothetical protein
MSITASRYISAIRPEGTFKLNSGGRSVVRRAVTSADGSR